MKVEIFKNKKMQMFYMIVFSWIIIAVFTIASDSRAVVLGMYALSAIIGLISVRYTYVVVILFMTTLFGTFRESNLIMGNLIDFALISVVGCTISQFVRMVKENNFKIEKWMLKEYKYIVIILMLLGVSIFVANWKYGQPIINGLMSFRYLFILIFIPILSKFLKENKEEFDNIERYCSWMIITSVIMVTIQLYVKDNITILKPFYTTRYGEYRVLMHNVATLYCVLFGYKLYKILVGQKERLGLDIITMLSILIATFVTTKTRTCMIMIIAITIVELLIMLRKKAKIAALIIGILMLTTIILFGMGFFDSVIQSLFKDVITGGDSYIRNACIDFYMGLIEGKDFWLGAGITNANYLPSPVNIATEQSYYFTDIGIFGFFFEYGTFGIIAMMILLFTLIKKIVKVKEANAKNLGIILIIFMICTFYTISPITSSVLVALTIITSYINSIYYMKDRKQK